MAKGEKTLAIETYQTSPERNPDNQNAMERLQALRDEQIQE